MEYYHKNERKRKSWKISNKKRLWKEPLRKHFRRKESIEEIYYGNISEKGKEKKREYVQTIWKN